MPRINPISEIERAICRRFRQFRREVTKLPLVTFAREIGIDSSRQSSYEHGRVVLPYSVARAAAIRFQLSLTWLASGDLPQVASFPTFPCDTGLQERLTFSEGFEKIRENLRVDALITKSAKSMLALERLYREFPRFWSAEFTVHGIGRALVEELLALPSELRPRLVGDLVALLERYKGDRQTDGELRFDNLQESVNLCPVTPTWDKVIERAKAATVEPGSKGKLAERLGVPQSRLSEWLGGKYEPGAGVAFQLLRKVEELEVAQKKMAASARTPAAVSTQPKDIDENVNKSGRRKK